MTATLRCLRCRYDLAGTAPEGVCPECALPVSHSAIDWSAGPGRAHLERVRGGVQLMSLALLTLWLEGLSFAFHGLASLAWAWFVLAAAAWMWSAGCLRVAAPGPLGMLYVDRLAKRLLRVSARLLFWFMALECVLVALSLLNFFDGMGESSVFWVIALATVSGVAALVCGIISWAEGFGVIGGIGASVLRDRGLRKRCLWMAGALAWGPLAGALLMAISPVLIALGAVGVNLLALGALGEVRGKLAGKR